MKPPRIISDDRVLVIKPIPGQDVKDSRGIIDRRLFTGENNLRIVRDPLDDLWYFKYDYGAVPPVIRSQKFTGFSKAYKYVERYLTKRGLQILEVKDNAANA